MRTLVELERLLCQPALGNLEKEIFPTFTLIVDLNESKQPKGFIQWLKRFQPDHCQIDVLNKFEISWEAKRLLQKKLEGR